MEVAHDSAMNSTSNEQFEKTEQWTVSSKACSVYSNATVKLYMLVGFQPPEKLHARVHDSSMVHLCCSVRFLIRNMFSIHLTVIQKFK